MSKLSSYFFIISIALYTACGEGKVKQERDIPEKKTITEAIEEPGYNNYHVIMKGVDTAEFKNHYDTRVLPPSIDLDVSLEDKTISELAILKNTVLAMKGNTFEDAILAAHFKQFQWYQPPFWDKEFSVVLNEAETKFFERIDARIADLQKENYTAHGSRIPQPENIVNWFQWQKPGGDTKSKLAGNGFVIAKADYDQLFELYQQNAMECIPSFITTDLVLNQLHLFYGELENEIEEQYLIVILQSILETLNKALYASYEKTLDPEIEKLIEENLLYYSIPYAVITNKKNRLLGDYNEIYFKELGKVLAGKGSGSKMMGNEHLEYKIFDPAGHYLKNERTRQYYKALSWLQNVDLCLSDTHDFNRAILMAYLINKNSDLKTQYARFNTYKSYFSSYKTQFTLWDLAAILEKHPAKPGLEKLFNEQLRKEMMDKLPAEGSSSCALSVSLMPREYQNLYTDLGVIALNTKEPSAVKLFAALGNPAALELVTGSAEAANERQTINNNLADISDHPDAIGMDWISTLLTSFNNSSGGQEYMQKSAWKRKELNTALAGWTIMGQRTNLQTKNAEKSQQPDRYPNSILKGYVEPNLAFWQSAAALLEDTKGYLTENKILTEATNTRLNALLETVNFLHEVSIKEIKGGAISAAAYERMAKIGTTFEQMTLQLIDPKFDMSDKRLETDMAFATNTCRANNLVSATGAANIILAMVEIDGFIYLTRGAVFSYYEPTTLPEGSFGLDEWKSMLLSKQAPLEPSWMRELMGVQPALHEGSLPEPVAMSK
ncbi:MAG: DUF3160 domain-containing protein [Cyclobacteriaceae bacterium]|nr:DUF3160 domain-containing protein [Cyclobacteriaceae bacterium]